MKRIFIHILLSLMIIQPVHAWNFYNNDFKEELAIKKVLKSQVKYANKGDFNKFISTYDSKYRNADGFNLDVYSNLIKDIWKTYDDIKYDIEILDITIDKNTAKVILIESSFADLKMSKVYTGELKSIANTIYYLEKINGNWKVISDSVIDETTTMLYGDATNLDIKLTVPKEINPNKDYTAILEFAPPRDTMAIASLASDKVEYPQKPTQEVFRVMPEDNILERIFTSNSDNLNEYIVASIGLTKTKVCDLSLKMSLTGFGYAIKRVNVIGEKDVKTE